MDRIQKLVSGFQTVVGAGTMEHWELSWALRDMGKTVWPWGSSTGRGAACSGLMGSFSFLHMSHCTWLWEKTWRRKTQAGYLWECQRGLRTVLLEWSLWATSDIYLSLWLSEKALQSLLESLTCPPYTPTQHLEREQALAKEFAEILHFTLRFDELKVRPHTLRQFSRLVLRTYCVPALC